MSLAVLRMNPFRVSPLSFGESLHEPFDSMAAHARRHGCASPERGTDQIGVIGAESDATVLHGAYDPIVTVGCQGQILLGPGFGFRDTGLRVA